MSSLNGHPPLWKSLESRDGRSDDGNEFIKGVSHWDPSLNRRKFLQLAASSLAIAGFAGCVRRPVEKILPYVQDPVIDPGKPVFFTSAYQLAGLSTGLLVETHEDRPTRIDGHPEHPSCLGASSAIHQALILSLYSEKRSAKVLHEDKESSWDEWEKEIFSLRQNLDHSGGDGLYFVSEISSSWTLKNKMHELQKRWPQARWIQYEPVSLENELQALFRLFHQDIQIVYDFSKAENVFSFDADFMHNPLYPLRYAQDFMAKRRTDEALGKRPFLWTAESTPSLTGAASDQRNILEPAALAAFAEEIYLCLQKSKVPSNQEIKNLIAKIKSAKGRNIFLAGPQQSVLVHEICQFLNFHYGKESVNYIAAFLPQNPSKDFQNFSEDLEKDKVKTLFILGGNPVYHKSLDDKFVENIKKVSRSYRFSLSEDESSDVCKWHLPLAHFLESWSEGYAYDGSPTLAQALVQPLFSGRSHLEIVSALLGEKSAEAQESFQNSWKKQGNSFPWEKLRSQGFAEKPRALSMKAPVEPSSTITSSSPVAAKGTSLTLIFRPDSFIWEGRFSQNPWLQECPRPLTSLTWENAVLISPVLAKQKKISSGQYLYLKSEGQKIKAPAWIMPGQAENTLTLIFGYGQKNNLDKTATGYNAYSVWNSSKFFQEVDLEVLSEKADLAATQDHQILPTNSPLKNKVNLKMPKSPRLFTR